MMVESGESPRRAAKRTTAGGARCGACGLALLVVWSACGDAPETVERVFDPLPVASQLALALTTDELPTVIAYAHPTKPLLIELRETLVETDERSSWTVAGEPALGAWLEENRPRWSCSGEGCRWPGGLVAKGEWSCFGDCCDLRPPGGMELETIYLRRVCLAHRDAGQPRLSLLAFYEAR